jgi:hypothetical protein
MGAGGSSQDGVEVWGAGRGSEGRKVGEDRLDFAVWGLVDECRKDVGDGPCHDG